MAYTQADYDALLEAYKAGALRVRHGEKEITYRSLGEMRRLLDSMARQIKGSRDRDPVGTRWNPGLGT